MKKPCGKTILNLENQNVMKPINFFELLACGSFEIVAYNFNPLYDEAPLISKFKICLVKILRNSFLTVLAYFNLSIYY